MDYKMDLKPPVEVRYREELEALEALDTERRPLNWKLSPKAVRTFILGSRGPWSGMGGGLQFGRNILETTRWWSAALSHWQEAAA